MANDTDDFFDTFKKKTLNKTKKFSFKKVERNNLKPVASETISRFFKPNDREKSKNSAVEDQLEALFSDSSIIDQSPIKNNELLKSNNLSIKDEIDKTDKLNSSITLPKLKFKTLPKSNSSEEFEKIQPTQKNSPKKKVEVNSNQSSSLFQFKKKNVNNIGTDAFKSLFGEQFTPNKIYTCKKSEHAKVHGTSSHQPKSAIQENDGVPKNITENRITTISLNETSKFLTKTNSSIDSPVIAQKKFSLKKSVISESSSTIDSNVSFKLKTLNNSKRESVISVSSTENSPITCQERKSKNLNILLNDEVNFISQTLATSENDYMDDETFEKLFSGAQEDNKKNNDLDLANIDWNEEFELNGSNNGTASTSKKNENYTAEISAIDWNEEVFAEEDPYIPEISFKDRQDDASEFQKEYHFSSVMEEVLHQKFGLQTFRPHQREVINATLNQHDCFVLMPTGGGKSLCYQLPAVLSEGVSIVISPLRALIGDQVDKMNGLDIPAAHLCQDVSAEESRVIMNKLHCREPLIKLLYLTPEKIMASRVVGDMLKNLYQRGKLARFVIDEAHCLSQWGHDFRPDYKQLSYLKNEFRDVSIMCLTATATKQVENDVISILKLKNVKRFIMSFNRPNIKYQVINKKGKMATEQIINLIKKQFLKKSGIIYCLARNDCENLADALNQAGIKTRPYHAGLSDKIRNAIQREWMQDRFFVIVATIAFGMGIDKPDVRFVLHNSLPKSVEAFYQESGRAGRDGDLSYSYLFYNYTDVLRLQKIMKLEKKSSAKVREGHDNNLKQMVSFAENVVDCRRYLQLIHLGENFDRKLCIRNKATTCDNCQNMDHYNNIEVTKEARELGILVKDLSSRSNITMLYAADVYKGSKREKIMQMGHNKHKYYGAGSSMDRTNIHRILKDLVLKNILGDHITYTGDFPVVYIKTGKKFDTLNASNLKILIPINKKSLKAISNVKEGSFDLKDDDSGSSGACSSDVPGPSKLPPLSSVKVKKSTYSAFNKTKIEKLKVKCHEDLLEECRRMALERNVTLSSIVNLTALKLMSDVFPKTKEEFLKIQHITAANYKRCGENFLAITSKYRIEVDALNTASKIISTSSRDSNDEDDWSSSFSQSSSNGRKRKSTGAYKKWGNKKRRTCKKKKSPLKKNTAQANKWTSTKKKSGGGLGLMPVHFK